MPRIDPTATCHRRMSHLQHQGWSPSLQILVPLLCLKMGLSQQWIPVNSSMFHIVPWVSVESHTRCMYSSRHCGRSPRPFCGRLESRGKGGAWYHESEAVVSQAVLLWAGCSTQGGSQKAGTWLSLPLNMLLPSATAMLLGNQGPTQMNWKPNGWISWISTAGLSVRCPMMSMDCKWLAV